MSSAALWHEVECGGYAADLAGLGANSPSARRPRCSSSAAGPAEWPCIWRGAATSSGRWTRIRRCWRRSSARLERALAIRVECADVRSLALGREFELIIAPMQLIQMLGGSAAARRSWGGRRRI